MTSDTSPPPPDSGDRKQKTRKRLRMIVALSFGAMLAGGAVFVAVVMPTVAKVRETARRTVDQANLRQIVQASLIAASERDGRLPPVTLAPDGKPSETEPATVHGVAALLAREGGLDDFRVWISAADPYRDTLTTGDERRPVLNRESDVVAGETADTEAVAWDYATGLTFAMPTSTPVAWTRGLRTDGTWDPDAGVYGANGGFVAFLSGTVQFFESLQQSPLTASDGTLSSNILAVLPAGTRVTGSGPGTLHGREGAGPEAD